MGAHEAWAEETKLLEVGDGSLAPALLGGDGLHFRLGQVGMKEAHRDPGRGGRSPGGRPRCTGWECVGASAARIRPPEVPGQRRRMSALRRQQPLGWRRADAVDRLAQGFRQEIEEARHRVVEHEISHRGRDHRAHPHVVVGASDGLGVLGPRRRQPHEKVIGARAPGLQHLHRAEGGRHVVVLGGAVGVEGRAVVQEILERPATGEAAQEVIVGVGVGVGKPGDDEEPCRVEDLGVCGRGEVGPDGADPLAVDEDVGEGKPPALAVEHVTAADEQGHGATSARAEGRWCKARRQAPSASAACTGCRRRATCRREQARTDPRRPSR